MPYYVCGQVQNMDLGVAGLKIEVLDKDFIGNDLLGTTYTDSAGNYSLYYKNDDPFNQLLEGELEVFIRIKDMTDQLLYRSKPQACPLDGQVTINVKLKSKVLENAQRAEVLKGVSGPVISPAVESTIQGAFDLLTGPGEVEARAVMNAAFMCPLPPLSEFDDLIDLSQDVLNGLPDSTIRFRDTLENFATWSRKGQVASNTPVSSEQAEALLSVSFLDDLEKAVKGRLPKGDLPPGAVGRKKTILLLTAAIMASDGDPVIMHRNLGIILGQLRGLSQVGRIYRNAQDVMSGVPGQDIKLLRTMKYFGGNWGPDDGPPRPGGPPRPWPEPMPMPFPWPPDPGPRPLPMPEDWEEVERWACTAELLRAFREARLREAFYTIDRISPQNACPGDLITIQGSNLRFEGRIGEVIFNTESGTVRATAERWSDTQIEVRVPADAICGRIALSMPSATIIACGTVIELFRPAVSSGNYFGGGKTSIRYFDATNLGLTNCAEPGARVNINYHVCNATSKTIIFADATGRELSRQSLGSDERGSVSLTMPNVTRTTEVTARLAVVGPCGSVAEILSFFVQKEYNLSVDGMEITQGIQYYRAAQHLTDVNDRGPDNSLRLVTNKTAWVRAYLRSGMDPAFDGGRVLQVDGTLRVERRVDGFWQRVATINSQNGPINAEASFPSYDAERGNINTSLNFVVNAALMTGQLRFTVVANSEDPRCSGNTASLSQTVLVNLTQTLNAAFITIGYNGRNATNTGNLNLPAPTLANCQAETAWAMQTFPLSGNPNVRVAGTFVTNTPLDDARSRPGGCSPNWGPLLQQIANIVSADTTAGNWVYYGIINGGIPVNVPGCNGAATGGLAGQVQTYAHEIAHQFGLPHAPCGNVGTPNANYPVYEPYDTPVDPAGTNNFTMASIGEYGLNINNGNIANPATAEDIMSYCGPSWVSIFTHNFLINRPVLNPQVVPTGDGFGAPRNIRAAETTFAEKSPELLPLVFLNGSFDEAGTLMVSSVVRLEAYKRPQTGKRTNYIAQLVAKDGSILSSSNLYRFVTEGCAGDCADTDHDCSDCAEEKGFYFQAQLLDTPANLKRGACIQIIKDDETIWERTCPKKAVKIESLSAKLGKKRTLDLAWTCNEPGGEDTHCWVRWSADKGKTWSALTTELTGSSASLPLDHIPGGEVKFELMVHNGYHTVSKQSKLLKLPMQAPAVSILYPRNEDDVYGSDRQIHLRASANEFNGHCLADDQVTWYLGKRKVGSGCDIWIDNPGPGKHQLKVEAKGPGGSSIDKSTIVIKA